MSKITGVVLMLIFSVQVSFAGIIGNKFQKGEIHFEDGTVKKGFVQVPKTDISMSIMFKESLESQEEKIKTITISSFTVYADNGEPTVFECVFADLSKNPNKQRVTKYKLSLMVFEKGYATLYMKGSKYKTLKDGTVEIVSYALQSEGGTPLFYYYLKKQDMDFAVQFDITHTQSRSIVIDFNKDLKKNVAVYFKEYPDLVERVQNGKFSHKSVPELVQEYNNFMVNK